MDLSSENRDNLVEEPAECSSSSSGEDARESEKVGIGGNNI